MVDYAKILNALQFYANKENYAPGYQGYGEDNDTRSLAAKDCGDRAREALIGITSPEARKARPCPYCGTYDFMRFHTDGACMR